MKFKFFLVIISIFALLLVACTPLQRFSNQKFYGSFIAESHVVVNNADNECWIFIRGKIERKTFDEFRAAVEDAESRSCERKVVVTVSSGGLIYEAFRIGEMVREKAFDTAVDIAGGGSCESACGMIFISGKNRIVPKGLFSSRIGFHQPSVLDGNGRKICRNFNSKVSDEIFKYANRMLDPTAAEIFHKNVMETDCTKVTYFGPSELIKAGIATDSTGLKIF